ncbi:hypothetical protein KC644_03945 [Candidatus Berkelbacteria bacterium]|nr:hypothetical protein [Candidatus Berkelbacteria bacterium]
MALGTDLPELFVSLNAGIDRLNGLETSGFAVGNIIGSSVAQAILILGLIIIISKSLKIPKHVSSRDIVMLVIATGLVLLLSQDGILSQTEGWALILVYVAYLLSILREENSHGHKKRKKLNLWWSITSIIAGFFALAYSADTTLHNSLLLAEHLGISQTIVGIVIVGIGTSLPELATSLVALKNSSAELAVGNVIGSTVFDLLFALGIGASFAGFNIDRDLFFDLFTLLVGMVLVYIVAKQKPINRYSGYALLTFFGLYLILAIS